jgi:hypothetical protein
MGPRLAQVVAHWAVAGKRLDDALPRLLAGQEGAPPFPHPLGPDCDGLLSNL